MNLSTLELNELLYCVSRVCRDDVKSEAPYNSELRQKLFDKLYTEIDSRNQAESKLSNNKTKTKSMTYSFYTQPERAQHILSELGKKAKISPCEEDSKFVLVEMNIDNDYDLLCLFHAGVLAGINVYSNFPETTNR